MRKVNNLLLAGIRRQYSDDNLSKNNERQKIIYFYINKTLVNIHIYLQFMVLVRRFAECTNDLMIEIQMFLAAFITSELYQNINFDFQSEIDSG